MRRALLLLIFVLILTFQTLNTQYYTGTGNKNSTDTDPLDSAREREINHNNSREVYRDGIVDPFDNFINTGFPTEHKEFCFRCDSGQIIKIHAN